MEMKPVIEFICFIISLTAWNEIKLSKTNIVPSQYWEKTLRSNYVELAILFLLHSIIVQLHQVNCKSFTTYALIIFSGWNMKGVTNKRLRLQKKKKKKKKQD